MRRPASFPDRIDAHDRDALKYSRRTHRRASTHDHAFPFHRSQCVTLLIDLRFTFSNGSAGHPIGTIAANLISGGIPSTSRLSFSATIWNVVIVVPSPSERAATNKFCVAGYSADNTNDSCGACG